MLGLLASFVKRAVILNNIELETGYSFEIVSQSKHSRHDINNVLRTLQ